MILLLLPIVCMSVLPLIAAHQASLRSAVAGVFGLLQTPFTLAVNAVGNVLRWLIARVREVFTPDDLPAAHRIQRVVGALLYTAATIVFFYADFWLMVLTLRAMGLSAGDREVPASADTLMAVALLSTAFFWGSVLLDLSGVTHLGPWDRFSSRVQKVILVVSGSCIVAAMGVGVLFGLWRNVQATKSTLTSESATEQFADGGIQGAPLEGSQALTDAPMEPGMGTAPLSAQTSPVGIDVWVPATINGVLPALLTVSAAFSAVGVAYSLGYLWGLTLCGVLIPFGVLGLVLRIGNNLCEMAFNIVSAGLDMIAGIGRSIWNWLCRFDWPRNTLHLRTIPEPPAEAPVVPEPPVQPETPAPQQPPQPPPSPQPTVPPDGAEFVPPPEPSESFNPLGL